MFFIDKAIGKKQPLKTAFIKTGFEKYKITHTALIIADFAQ